MRRLIGLLSIAGIALMIAKLGWQPSTEYAKTSHCNAPIAWRLASLDPQFKLDETQALHAIRAAAAAWNQQLGTVVFVEDQTQGFPIHFIYDERQQRLLAGQRVARNVANYDQYLTQLAAEVTQLRADYEQRYATFEQQKQQFQQQLSAGELTGSAAQSQQQILQQQADEVNAYAAKLNDKQQHYQQTISDRNALIPTEMQRARIAEVGLLIRENNGLAMKIFAYHDEATLILTLTHEFGHALGIGHLTEPSAIMHAELSADQQALTSADVTAAKQLCDGSSG